MCRINSCCKKVTISYTSLFLLIQRQNVAHRCRRRRSAAGLAVCPTPQIQTVSSSSWFFLASLWCHSVLHTLPISDVLFCFPSVRFKFFPSSFFCCSGLLPCAELGCYLDLTLPFSIKVLYLLTCKGAHHRNAWIPLWIFVSPQHFWSVLA